METSAVLAIARVGPGVDLTSHRSLLAARGIALEPWDADNRANDRQRLPVLWLLAAPWWAAQDTATRTALSGDLRRRASATILVGPHDGDIPRDLDDEQLGPIWLDAPIGDAALRAALHAALARIAARLELAESQRLLRQRTHDMHEVHRVGIALSAERDLDALQRLILRTSREMTRADAGTLFLVGHEEERGAVLLFHVTQNDSIDMPFQQLAMPVTKTSMSGYVAATGETLRIADVYSLPGDVEYGFNPSFDQRLGYRSRSMLVVPMCNHRGEVVGVIQLINRKRHFDALLRDAASFAREVEPFTDEDEALLSSFASQAAVVLENRMLLDSIQKLFAGFVRASVTAIESRDPATSGHSDRVARLTVGLARTINDVGVGRWRDLRFSDEQIREIEYAGLLHDFGKVGVREHVLVKAKKLYDGKLDQVKARFWQARAAVEQRSLRLKLDAALAYDRADYARSAAEIDADCARELADLDQALAVVLAANEPTVLPEARFQALLDVAARTVRLPDGSEAPLIAPDELRSLTVRRGTLDDDEMRDIQSHVTHSFNFLIQIPWTRELQHVPDIAHAHHEKLNGSGYPRRLHADEIPIQARMMTIADIFDALAAQDRPYKPAVPVAKALDILTHEAHDGLIDADMLDLFIRRAVYRLIERGTPLDARPLSRGPRSSDR